MSIETHQFYQNLLDPVSQEIMFDAVNLNCGHTVSQKTADACIQMGLPCPIDQAHTVISYVPSLITRKFVQLAALPAPFSPAQKSIEVIEKLMSAQQLLMADLAIELKSLRGEKKRQDRWASLPRIPVHSMKLEELKLYFGEEFQELRSFADITKILLWPCPLWSDKATFLGLTEVMQQCLNLNALNLSWCQSFANEDLEAIVQLFPNVVTNSYWKISSLCHLDLNNCYLVTDVGLLIIGQNCPNLRGLILNGCSQITDEGILLLSNNVGGTLNCPQMLTLGLGGTRVSDQTIKRIHAFCPNLHSFDFSHCKHITDDGITYIAIAETYRQNLRALNLQGCSQLTMPSIKLLASSCPNLHLLELEDKYGIRGIEALRQMWPDAMTMTLDLKGFKNVTDAQLNLCVQKGTGIRTIDLTGCSQITDASIAVILQNCPDLQAIHWTGTQISDAAIQTLKERCPHLYSPSSIAFGKAKWETYLGLTEVQESLNRNTLNLSWCQSFANEDVEAIVQCFPNLASSLCHLDLSNCNQVTDAGLFIIGENFPNLQVLILNGCSQITDEGVLVLAYNVRGTLNCPQMQTLKLSGTRVTDKAIKDIHEFCPNVHSLDLSHCQRITDEGVLFIAEAYGQNLRALNLQGCPQLTMASIKLLSGSCPNLELLELEDKYGISRIEELRQMWSDVMTMTLDLKEFKNFTDAQLNLWVQKDAGILTIDLTGCRQITDASIAAIVQNCPSLQAVYWEGTQISVAGLKTLKAHFPHLFPFLSIPSIAFGKAKWETYFGDVGEEPLLPRNIHEMLARLCPFDQTKTVQETHLLVLVPTSVNGVPLTFNRLGELVKKPKGGGHSTKYREVWGPITKQCGEVPSAESHWVLMMRDVLPGTRNKSFKNQCAILEGFRDFQVPTLW